MENSFVESPPVEIRRGIAALWVAAVLDILQRGVNVTVKVPAGTPHWLVTGAAILLFLVVFGLELLIPYVLARGILRRQRWARLTVILLFALSLLFRVPWLASHASADLAVLGTVGFIGLGAYVISCLFGRVGRTWFTPSFSPSSPTPGAP